MTTFTYEHWLNDSRVLAELKTELQELIDQDKSEELKERFSKDLEFGTGGLRAKMGVGTNRLNVFTVRKATYGVVAWMKERFPNAPLAIAIGYDGRHHSKEFAFEVACVAAAHGVKAHVYEEERPTPMLSFAVRELACQAGVMLTASHNPPEYNGYKVYGQDGGQVLPDEADVIVRHTLAVTDLFSVPVMAKDEAIAKGLLHTIAHEVEEAYFNALLPLSRAISDDVKKSLKIVYTPLHGTGQAAVPKALAHAGFTEVHVVAQQQQLDPNFTYVKNPNPEEAVAYDLALTLAKEIDADVILATDPDADRVGVMAKDAHGKYVFFSGNEVGALVLDDYLAYQQTQGTLPGNARVVTTNVSSAFGEEVAKCYGVSTERVLTGFKFIGDRIKAYEATGSHTFVFGYEESIGYLALPIVRDKDSVQAAILIANAAAAQKEQGSNLVQARSDLFNKVGFFADRLLGFTFAGLSGIEMMNRFMQSLREQPLLMEDLELVAVEDYLAKTCKTKEGTLTPIDLPSSDVMQFRYAHDGWIAVRPSGTEPKLKVYIGVKGRDEDDAKALAMRYEEAVRSRLAPFLT